LYKKDLFDKYKGKMILNNQKQSKHFSGTGGKMHSPTYDELVNIISAESDKIATIDSMKSTLSRWNYMFRVLYIVYISKRLVWRLNKIQKTGNCIKCSSMECPYVKDLPDKLPPVVTRMHPLIDRYRELHFPNFLINLHQSVIDDFEDIIENNTLASDVEIEQLTLNIAKKMNQGHGIQNNKLS
jgi:hypothetical protein